MQPYGVNHWYFKLLTIGISRIHSLQYQRSETFGCKDVKSEIIRVWGEFTVPFLKFICQMHGLLRRIRTRLEPVLQSIEESTTELLGRWFEDRNILRCYQ